MPTCTGQQLIPDPMNLGRFVVSRLCIGSGIRPVSVKLQAASVKQLDPEGIRIFLKEIEDLENKLKNRYSISQILEAWTSAYGEDMEKEYPGFIQRLQEEKNNANKK